MEITAEIIAGIKYKQHLKCDLTIASLENFEVNSAKSSMRNLFAEARENNFSVILEKG